MDLWWLVRSRLDRDAGSWMGGKPVLSGRLRILALMVEHAGGNESQSRAAGQARVQETALPFRSRPGAIAWSTREELLAAFHKALKEIRSRTAWSPIWVVCPNRLSARVWERELATAEGLFNVQVLSAEDLAGFLLGAVARTPATSRQIRQGLRRSLAVGGVSELAQLDHEMLLPLFARVMERLTRLRTEEIERLLEGGPESDGRPELAREVAAVVQRARASLGTGVRVGAEEIQRAAEVLQQSDVGTAALPKGLEVVWMLADVPRYPVDELLQGISSVVPCTRLVWQTGEETLDQSLVAAVGSAEPVAGSASVAGADGVAGVTGQAEQYTHAEARTHESLVVAPDLQTEAELAVASLVEAAEGGLRWSEMAVLWPKREPYEALVRVALAERGIPVANSERSTVRESHAGRWLLALGHYLVEPHRRQRSERLLHAIAAGDGEAGVHTSAHLTSHTRALGGRHANTRVKGQPINEWLRIAKRLRLRGGLRDWLRNLASRDLSRLQKGEQAEAERFRAFLEVLSADLDGSPKSWTQWSLQIEKAMDMMLGDVATRATWPSREVAAAELLLRSVRGLRELDDHASTSEAPDEVENVMGSAESEEATESTSAAQKVSAQSCLAEIEASLAEMRIAATSQEGVHLAGVDEAFGAGFAVAVVMGMNDGVFPSSPPTDLLSEAFALPGDTLDRDSLRRSFLGVRALSRRVVWSAARADIALGQELFLSPWILDLASSKEGRVVTVEELLSGAIPWCRSYASRYAALKGPLRTINADHECLATVLSRENAEGLEGHVSLHTRRRLMHHERTSEAMSVFEGVLDSQGDVTLRPEDLPTAYSASALQRWATCPMQFWFHSILRVNEEEDRDPEERGEDLRDIGTLYHRVLERTFSREQALLSEGSLAWPKAKEKAEREALRSARQAIAMEEVDNAFAVAVAVGSLAEGPFLSQVRASVEDALERFLEAELDWRMDSGMSPIAFEHSFGMSDRIELSLPEGRTLALRGVIDRVDRDAEGRVVVTDYKTSSMRNLPGADKKDLLGFGHNIQLDCYREGLRGLSSLAEPDAPTDAPTDVPTDVATGLEAVSLTDSAANATSKEDAAIVSGSAEAATQDGPSCQGQYWSLQSPFPRVTYALDDERRERFLGYLSDLLAAIQEGYFPPAPHDYEKEAFPGCTRCSYRSACPPSRVDVSEELTEKATRFLEIVGRRVRSVDAGAEQGIARERERVSSEKSKASEAEVSKGLEMEVEK